MSASVNYRTPILPFRFRPYRNMLALSVGLCISIGVFAIALYSIISILAFCCLALSYLLGFIVATAIVGAAYWANSDNNNSDAGAGFLFLWFIIWIVLTALTTAPLYNAYQFLSETADLSWNNLMTLYEESKIVYWSWIPIISMVLYGIISLLSLWIMKLLDWRPHWGRIRFICPHEDCGHVSSSLVYQCPHCNGVVENLYPSINGIYFTSCPHCGASLNASWLTGRNQYSKTCPDCHKDLNYEGFGDIPESVFVVEGAQKSGKTSFLIRAMSQWNQRFSSFIHFSDAQQERNVVNKSAQISAGNFCIPTTRRLCPEAYLMHCKKSFHSFLAYFYDTGGASVNALEAGVAEPYYSLANGIFLVIDPWAEKSIINVVSRNRSSHSRQFTHQFASQSADAVIGILCSKLEHLYADSVLTGFNVPICVVVTKCDLNGLDNAIGVELKYSQSSKHWSEQSQKVEEFLANNGLYNFVNIVKTRFKRSAFFAVSVLDDSADKSSSVLNPLLWMTCNAH